MKNLGLKGRYFFKLIALSTSMIASFGAHGFSVQFDTIYFSEGMPKALDESSQGDVSLDYDQRKTLEVILKGLKEDPSLGVHIMGFSDARECQPSDCYSLSLRRAEVVYAWLHKHGVPKAQLKGPTGESTNYPIYTGEAGGSEILNRRVEFSPFDASGRPR